jgi:isopentenyl diphosphate isomerase/L-lactate dehydrogenase-like FMN-dependent dehydrogenase
MMRGHRPNMTRDKIDADQCLTLHEIVAAAHAALDRNLWDYIIGGTATETTVARNRLALDSIAFRPRVLNDVSKITTGKTFIGHEVRLPVMLAPVGGLASINEDGNIKAACAATDYGVPYILSSVNTIGLEKIADAAPGPKLFQLYTRGDDRFVDDHVLRARDSGYDAFCITVDSALYSRRERDIAKRYAKPWRGNTPGMEYQASFSWADVRRFKDKHQGVKLILKGIGAREDAALACQYGVDGIYVSNHGGRQLDHGLGSMDILPGVVEEVAGRAMVIVDGGICRGTDVVKAIALGADMVGIGRLYCYGLGAAGQAGVRRVLELLEIEVAECLGLLGATKLSEVGRGHVCSARPVAEAHALSAFPLIDIPRGAY